MYKISIIVPIFNDEKYLVQCLETLVNQTLNDIEIICINDGSSDNSLNIIKKYSGNYDNIRVISRGNFGYGISLNEGIKIAQGEYVGIVESDDFIDLNMFEKLFKITKIKKFDIIKSKFFNYKNNKVKPNNCFSDEITDKEIKYIDDKIFFGINCPSIWSAIYNRQFLLNNNIIFNETPGASYQDTSFSFKVLSCCKSIYFIKDFLYYYRIDNNNSSVKRKDKIFCICDEFDEIDNFLNRRIDLKEKYSGIKNKLKFNSYNWNISRLSHKNKKIFLKYISSEFKNLILNNEIEKKYFTYDELVRLNYIANYNNIFFRTRYNILKNLKTIFQIKNKDGFKRFYLFGLRIYKEVI